jgi:hypothetical protein
MVADNGSVDTTWALPVRATSALRAAAWVDPPDACGSPLPDQPRSNSIKRQATGRAAQVAGLNRCTRPMLVIGRPISRSLERTFSTGRCRQFCAHLGRSARRPCFSRAVVQGCGANCLSWVDLRRSAFERKHVEAGHSSRGLIFPIFSRCRIGDSLFKIGHV